MIVSFTKVLALTVALGASSVGCNHHEEPARVAAEMSPKGGVGSAVESITNARCDRETRCNNIGAGKTYDSRDACTSKLHGSTESDVNTKDCPDGIKESGLSDCLAKIKAEDCGNPLDTLGRMAACRTGDLCMSH